MMVDTASPMIGVATQRGRWIPMESGGRRWLAGSPAMISALGDCMCHVVICLSSRVFLAKDQGCVCKFSMLSV